MHSTVAVQDLKIGMFIRLDLGWMSHPFPLSSFRISSADQIATLRGLGLDRVVWLPEKSDLPEEGRAEPVALAPVAIDEAALAAERRRAAVRAQRESLARCEAQYHEATQSLKQIGDLLNTAPESAARQAETLARAMLDKMLAADDLCIRLLTTHAGDRVTAHALNVTVISMLMARALGLTETELMDVGTGALLHHIGKLDLPMRVHHPEDGFSAAETKAYRDHVQLGLTRARRMNLPTGATLVLAQHHELADGSGYPKGLKGEQMDPAARIVSLVNYYDNLCNPGDLAKAMTPHEALSLMFAQRRSKFDARALQVMIRCLGVYPPGSVVRLSNDTLALVSSVNPQRPLRPWVTVYDPQVPKDEAIMLNLEEEPEVNITKALRPIHLPPEVHEYLSPRKRVTYYFDGDPRQGRSK